MLQVCDLTLTFGGVRAIAGLNLDVHGEVLAIIGPNGAGKTSTLNAITRVPDVSGGEILFKGEDWAKVPRHQIARHGIARTFQNIELFDAATVMDNLLLGRHRFDHGVLVAADPAHTRRHAVGREGARRCGGGHRVSRSSASRNAIVSSPPYGVRKVVELGRALCTQPQLLFLDELRLGPQSRRNPRIGVLDR